MHNAYCVHIVEGEGGGEQQQRARTQEEDQERGKTKKGKRKKWRERREGREVVVASGGGQFLSSVLSHLISPFFSLPLSPSLSRYPSFVSIPLLVY